MGLAHLGEVSLCLAAERSMFSLCNGKRSLWLGQNIFLIPIETCV